MRRKTEQQDGMIETLDAARGAAGAAIEQPLSIQVHAALNGQEWIAFIPTNTDLAAQNLKLGLVYGKTRYEAASKMLGVLDRLNLLTGRILPIVFQED